MVHEKIRDRRMKTEAVAFVWQFQTEYYVQACKEKKARNDKVKCHVIVGINLANEVHKMNL